MTVPLTAALPLTEVLDLLGPEVVADGLPTMDDLGQEQGFALYRCLDEVPGGVLELGEVRDRAQVFSVGVGVGVLNRDHGERWIVVPPTPAGGLELLVEDLGRVNYGVHIGEPKGLVGPALLDGVLLQNWAVRPLPLDDVAPVVERTLRAGGRDDGPGVIGGPAFAVGLFDTPRPQDDHFLDTTGWGKGVVWLNGFCLGRFWSRGPQHTLYVPAPLLRAQGNELLVLLLDGGRALARFVADLDLGHTQE